MLAAQMATPALVPDTRALVADFIGYKLRQKGYLCGAGPGEGPAADPLHQAMRAAGDEFENHFQRTFSDLAAQLHVTLGSAQQFFTQVCDELFQGGPNWGRLVGFFVFGAALIRFLKTAASTLPPYSRSSHQSHSVAALKPSSLIELRADLADSPWLDPEEELYVDGAGHLSRVRLLDVGLRPRRQSS
ncbi:PREDICTED: bcl-2-like protein 2 [Propithecus coquereli]|uniref:bcl-2-like protein 2 n=1 Tax=Propithecus coquereli TaxID=379532 RepID=UPI00063F81FA|nr:PREDICTED: bcl-2-like protein 2 [Propithecus coquereli]